MAIRSSQQRKLVKDMAMFFAEIGEIPRPREYEKLPNRPFGARLREINRVVGSWQSLLTKMEKDHPDLWDLIHKPAEKEPSALEKLSAGKTEV